MFTSERTYELMTDPGFVFGLGKTLESLNMTAAEIACTNIPVLILGESGSGKDVYARLLHRLSRGSDVQLKKINCSILDPAELLRQVHETSRSSSLDHSVGTLFLDGIDELDLACQRVLLSILPDSQDRTGATDRFARLISSSSRNLEESVEAGAFRKELYFRLNGFCLRLPPLRERKEDVGALLEHFLRKYGQELNRPLPLIDQETIDILSSYDWPGNIRQLENLGREIVVLGNPQLAVKDLPIKKADRGSAANNLEKVPSLKTAARAASRERERELILEALERTKWNRKRAARELQISYKALLYKLKQI